MGSCIFEFKHKIRLFNTMKKSHRRVSNLSTASNTSIKSAHLKTRDFKIENGFDKCNRLMKKSLKCSKIRYNPEVPDYEKEREEEKARDEIQRKMEAEMRERIKRENEAHEAKVKREEEALDRKYALRKLAKDQFQALGFASKLGFDDEELSAKLTAFGVWFVMFLVILIWFWSAGVFDFDCEEYRSAECRFGMYHSYHQATPYHTLDCSNSCNGLGKAKYFLYFYPYKLLSANDRDAEHLLIFFGYIVLLFFLLSFIVSLLKIKPLLDSIKKYQIDWVKNKIAELEIDV